MSSICDTRLLLTFHFPPSDSIRAKMRALVEAALRRRMIIPAVVIAEYIKIAGSRVGAEAALTHVSELETRGASTAPLDREVAVQAGDFLLAHPSVPIADAVIAATAKVLDAEHILSDDPHFKTLGIPTRWL